MIIKGSEGGMGDDDSWGQGSLRNDGNVLELDSGGVAQ